MEWAEHPLLQVTQRLCSYEHSLPCSGFPRQPLSTSQQAADEQLAGLSVTFLLGLEAGPGIHSQTRSSFHHEGVDLPSSNTYATHTQV